MPGRRRRGGCRAAAYAFARELVRPRHLLVLALAILADFVATLHFLSLARGWLGLVVLSGFCLPFVNLLGSIAFIESKSLPARLAITSYTALGICVGTTATLLLCQ